MLYVSISYIGNVGLKPELSLGEEDRGLGISLGGFGDLGVGISDNKEKKHSGKKQFKKHKQSKDDSLSKESSEISVVGRLLKGISDGISAGMEGDADFSFGTRGISANIDGQLEAGVNSKEDKNSLEEEEKTIAIPIVDGKNSGSYEILSNGTKIIKTSKTDNVKEVIITSLGDKVDLM